MINRRTPRTMFLLIASSTTAATDRLLIPYPTAVTQIASRGHSESGPGLKTHSSAPRVKSAIWNVKNLTARPEDDSPEE